MLRHQSTLKEKLKDHYYVSKVSFKTEKSNVSSQATGLAMAGGVITFLVTFFILLPSYYTSAEGKALRGYRWAQLAMLWLCVEVCGNWWLTYYDVLNRVTKETKEEHFPGAAETPPGWRTCVTCMLDAPPRSHHCTLCGHCILKRDQHCFVTSSCIGYHNQRRFVVLCLYSSIISLLLIYYQLAYLNKVFPISSYGAAYYFPLVTVPKYLTGSATFMQLLIVILLYTIVVNLAFSLFFLGWQLLLITRGQTSFEAWKQISIYRRRSMLDNIFDVFGNPLQLLICLFIPMRQISPSDGVKWVIEPKAEKGH